jgi:hypothetical protein
VYVPAGTYQSSGLPISADDTIIVGAGSGATIFDSGGGPGLRVEAADDVALFNLTLQNGRGTDRQGVRGGNLYFASRTPSGTLLLSGLDIRQGNATYGGGVFAGAGRLTMVDTRVQNNGATQGGGIYVGGYSAILDGVAIDGNGASEGGGGVWTAASTSVRNSTFYSNGSPYYGGAVTAAGSAHVDLIHVTMGRNHSAGASELAMLGDSTVNLTNTIVGMPGTAGAADGILNGGGTACYFSAGALVDDHSMAFDSSCHLSTARGSIENADPQFLSFGDYGGPTPSLPFASTSPAIDAANSDPAVCPAIDQRYAPRPVGTGCDIGALESPFSRVAPGGGGGGSAPAGSGGGSAPVGGGDRGAPASADSGGIPDPPVAAPPIAPSPATPVLTPPSATPEGAGSLAKPRLARNGRLAATATLPATPRGLVTVTWTVRKGGGPITAPSACELGGPRCPSTDLCPAH